MMETPLRALHPVSFDKPKYTQEEKQQLLANLDLEVDHRIRQFEASLADILENFKNHHEGQVLRVPRLVRNITMAEFGDKYKGDINECLKGLQMKRHGEPTPIDPVDRKRKWHESQDDLAPSEADSLRTTKSARLHQTPKKTIATSMKTPHGGKTPTTTRQVRMQTPLASPLKRTTLKPNVSPTKPTTATRPPSSNFNPTLPRAPSYPRLPRQNESLVSLNGSPLAMPPSLSSYPTEEDIPLNDGPSLRKQRSSILIRSDPSQNSRPTSQASSQLPQTPSKPHSQSNSQQSLAQSHPTASQRSSAITALVRVPTKDGHVLEFDPLATSPEELDALQGITASAKKQAKDDMIRLVHSALAKWKI